LPEATRWFKFYVAQYSIFSRLLFLLAGENRKHTSNQLCTNLAVYLCMVEVLHESGSNGNSPGLS